MLASVWRFLRKLKRELPYDPAIPLLGIHPDKTIIQKDIHTLMFIAVVFTVAKIWKQLKCLLMNVGIKKVHAHTYTHTVECHSAIKRRKA